MAKVTEPPSTGLLQDRQWREAVAEASSFSETETNTGQTWIDGKEIYRTVVDTGTLPNTTTVSTAHGLSPDEVVRIYGWASNGSVWIPLPYADTTTSNLIEVKADGTNVVIKTAVDYSSYTTSYVILEYTKS